MSSSKTVAFLTQEALSHRQLSSLSHLLRNDLSCGVFSSQGLLWPEQVSPQSFSTWSEHSFPSKCCYASKIMPLLCWRFLPVHSPMDPNGFLPVSGPWIAQKTASPQWNKYQQHTADLLQLPQPYTCPTATWITPGIPLGLGALEEFSFTGTRGSAARYRWRLWAHKHLSQHSSKTTGQPQQMLVYSPTRINSKKKKKYLSIVRKTAQVVSFKEHKLNVNPATSQVNTASSPKKYLLIAEYGPLNTIWVCNAAKETCNYTITSSRQNSRRCLQKYQIIFKHWCCS